MDSNKVLNKKRKLWLVLKGFDATQYQSWRAKWKGLSSRAKANNFECTLTFFQYMRLAMKANIYDSNLIGRTVDSYQMGRKGDTGGYVPGNCRFITMRKNAKERSINGGALRGGEKIRGRTKATDSSVASMANKLRGRTKESHEGVAAGAKARSRKFVLKSPNGKTHTGLNLKEFCRNNGLEFTAMCRTLNGKYRQHRGWTGKYLS